MERQGSTKNGGAMDGTSPAIAPDPEPVGLVLAGGGARCAYQAGALRAIAEMLPADRNPFPVIVGQSAGAINAACLASRAGSFSVSAERLVEAWSRLRLCDVFRTDPFSVGCRGLRWVLMAASGGWLAGNPRSFLDNAPLRELLLREVDFDAIEPAVAAGSLATLALTASAYSGQSGQAVTFFTGAPGLVEWTRSRRSGLRRRLGVEHVMASAALPFLFPAQQIEGQYFGDGALRLTAPLSPAIRLGARRLLVIAARDPEVVPLGSQSAARYPSLGALAGHMLDIIFNDHLDSDIERLTRINNTLALLTGDQRAGTPLRPIDVFVLRPSRDVREIAARHAGKMPWAIRMLLRGIGGWGGDWRLPSYLNFDAAYCRDLIELGERDARAQAEPILSLLAAGAGIRTAAQSGEGYDRGADSPGTQTDGRA